MTNSELFVQDKEVVVPGQILAEGMEYLPSYGTYRKNDQIIANKLGLLTVDGKVLRTIPLSGQYYPKRNDIVIAKVIDILSVGWRVEFDSYVTGLIPVKDGTFEFVQKGGDLTRYFAIEDFVVCKITNVSSQGLVDLSAKGPGLRKLRGGRMMKINAHKVPRIIGKKGSMVSMIKNATDCKITVGQNGRIWLQGEPQMEFLAIKTIEKIDRESHVSGLTDRIKEYLEKETGKTIDVTSKDDENTTFEQSENEN